MATSRQKFVFATLAVFIVMFVLVFGGVSATAYASQFSLPGDALYPVKTSLEQTQLGLSLNAARQAELQLEFAQRRLDEVATLIEEGRYNDIETATSEFEYHIQQAIDTLELVAAGDPARAEELAAKIASALSSYASTLSGMMANVPEAVKPAFERAMNVFQPAGSVAAEDHDEIEFTGIVDSIDGDTWTVDGRDLIIGSQTEIKGSIVEGDVVKVHAYRTGDGTLVAREIEIVVDDEIADDDVLGNENENMNGNDNQNDAIDNLNGNDNDIENMNDDYNGNGNGNENDNFNGDDHNDNVNKNTNDNENANHNDNSNDNSHDNGNDNGHDNGNSNDNDNSSNNNGNDNSGGDD